MGTPSAGRFTLTANGRVRSVLSVAERKNKGDLVLTLRAGGRSRDLGRQIHEDSSYPHHGKAISEHRISIHASRESLSGVNTIKLTRLHEDGTEQTRANVTSAIKQENQFSFVYLHRCSDLLTEEYDVGETDAKNISLGSFDSLFTPIFAVFVGHADRAFHQPLKPGCNIIQRVFLDFRLVILWSFLSVPAHESAMLMHNITFPNTPQLGKGSDERKCIHMFKSMRVAAANEFFEVLSGFWRDGITPDTTLVRMMENAKFFDSGNSKSPEYLDWLRASGLAHE